MIRSFVLFATTLCLGGFLASAHAVTPLKVEELRDYCSQIDSRPASDSARLCVTYIGGFLDGAVATDARVAENVAAEADTESFSERAFRTRVARRLQQTGPTGYAEFCVGEPVPVIDVARLVVEELERPVAVAPSSAGEVVDRALRRNYPCDARNID